MHKITHIQSEKNPLRWKILHWRRGQRGRLISAVVAVATNLWQIEWQSTKTKTVHFCNRIPNYLTSHFDCIAKITHRDFKEMHFLMAAVPFSPYQENANFVSVFTGLFLLGFLSIFCESLQWPITFISWQMGGTRNQENFGKYKFVRFLQSPQQFSFVF